MLASLAWESQRFEVVVVPAGVPEAQRVALPADRYTAALFLPRLHDHLGLVRL